MCVEFIHFCCPVNECPLFGLTIFSWLTNLASSGTAGYWTKEGTSALMLRIELSLFGRTYIKNPTAIGVVDSFVAN